MRLKTGQPLTPRSRMGSFRITQESCHPHIFHEVASYLEDLRPFVPHWVDVVRVLFDSGGGEDDTLHVHVNEEYRSLTLSVGNGWARVAPGEKSRYVLHEILHVYTDPLYDAYVALLSSTTVPDSAIRSFAEDVGRKAVERTVNDLERLFADHHDQFSR